MTSLRYDKRGVGASTGDYLSAGFHDNVADARAVLETLRARPEVDPGRVFVVGHSEGALIASELASSGGLAGVALLAGAARTGEEVLRWQAGQVEATLPAPVRFLLRLFGQNIVDVQTKRLARLRASTEDVIRVQFVKINARWFREFMAFDPARALAAATVPVLAVTGAKDIQVDPDDVGAMGAVVSTPFSGHVVDDVTHLLRADEGTPSVRTYKKQATRPLDDRVVSLVVGFVSDSDVTGAPHRGRSADQPACGRGRGPT